MDRVISIPTGTITVDHECTMHALQRHLRAHGIAHIKASDITRPERSIVRTAADMRGISEDEYLERFARRSAAEISRRTPNNNRSSSAANGR